MPFLPTAGERVTNERPAGRSAALIFSIELSHAAMPSSNQTSFFSGIPILGALLSRQL
jgi:hypothetical protein